MTEFLTAKEVLEDFKIGNHILKKWRNYGLKYKIVSPHNFQYKYDDIIEFINQPKFYVYVFLDTSKIGPFKYDEFEYQPFYVGKGIFDRCETHLKRHYLYVRIDNKYKCNKIKKLLTNNINIKIIKLFENLTEDESYIKEEKLIRIIGIKESGGPLTNLTYGGIGGRKMSDESKEKMKKTIKDQFESGERISPMLGKTHSPETLKKCSRKGFKFSDKQKVNLKKVRENNKNKSQTLWWKITSPNNEIFIVYGLGQFCREHNLSQSHMFSVAKGIRKHHKNWKCEYYKKDLFI
jgi:hypothetical protein